MQPAVEQKQPQSSDYVFRTYGQYGYSKSFFDHNELIQNFFKNQNDVRIVAVVDEFNKFSMTPEEFTDFLDYTKNYEKKSFEDFFFEFVYFRVNNQIRKKIFKE